MKGLPVGDAFLEICLQPLSNVGSVHVNRRFSYNLRFAESGNFLMYGVVSQINKISVPVLNERNGIPCAVKNDFQIIQQRLDLLLLRFQSF